jgi:mannose-6-phosphate isomerase-like protein (cupin superfamily)
MSTLSRSSRLFAALPFLGVLVVAPTAARAQTAAPLKWGPAPAVFPHGAKMAVVSGDPAKSGSFTADLALPSGYRIPPHWHPTDEHVAVKQGTLLVGMGDTMDRTSMKSMKTLKKGESVDVKANMHHYAAARGRTVIEVTANGPFAMTYVNAADDPQSRTTAKAKNTKAKT